jgi:hypothetical protein
MEILDAQHAADMIVSTLRERNALCSPFKTYVDGCVVIYSPGPASDHQYSPMVFDPNDPVFMAGGSSITNRIGIPLLLRTSGSCYKPSSDGMVFIDNPGTDANPMATLLKRDVASACTGSSATDPLLNNALKMPPYWRVTGFTQ